MTLHDATTQLIKQISELRTQVAELETQRDTVLAYIAENEDVAAMDGCAWLTTAIKDIYQQEQP